MVSVFNESRQVRRYKERNQRKTLRIQENIDRQTYLKINRLLATVLSEDVLQELAKKTGFQQRKRELTKTALIGILLLGCSNCSNDVPVAVLDVMCMYLRKWFNIHVKKQSLQKRINCKQTAMFVKAAMTKLMGYEIDKVLGKVVKKSKKYKFARILIQDSTVISLPEDVAKIFRGCGGAASKAAVKCDYIIDQQNHLIVKMRCVAGRVPDSALSGDIISIVQEGDLIIRDLGYFNLTHFSKILSKNAHFISRLSKVVLVYLNKNDEEPINLIEYLEKLHIRSKEIDIDVYIGKKERLLVRLIAVKVPSEVVESRRQQYKKARGRSKEPSESLQEWHGYTLMITNISRDDISYRTILQLYKVRWQIELFFKNLKSILVVHIMTGENKYRIICLIFTKLAVAWIASLLYAYAQTITEGGKEVSRFKFTRWLKDLGNLKDALCRKDFSALLQALEKDLDLLLKETKKRSKQDTEENVWYEKIA